MYEGVIHEEGYTRKIFMHFMTYMHKRWPLGYTRAKTEDLKKFLFAFAAKSGLYTKGVIHEGVEALQYSN